MKYGVQDESGVMHPLDQMGDLITPVRAMTTPNFLMEAGGEGIFFEDYMRELSGIPNLKEADGVVVEVQDGWMMWLEITGHVDEEHWVPMEPADNETDVSKILLGGLT